MAFFNFPYHITRDTPAVAVEVQTNFDSFLAWVLENVIQKDGSVAMTGPLVLAPGSEPGAPGQTVDKAYVDAMLPIGIMMDYGGQLLPDGWLWCDGGTYSNTSKSRLYSVIGRSFTAASVPGNSFSVPDRRQRVSVGKDASDPAFVIGAVGGQRNSEVMAHVHPVPAHGHTSGAVSIGDHPAHTHGSGTLQTNSAPNHLHGQGSGADFLFYDTGSTLGYTATGSTGSFWKAVNFSNWGDADNGGHSHDVSGATSSNIGQSHTVTGFVINDKAEFDTKPPNGTEGTTTVDKNLPPYLAVNVIIYAGK